MTNLTNLLPVAPGAENLAAQVGSAGPVDPSVADQFEGIFMSLVVKQMRQSLGEGGLFGDDASDVYGGMFDLFMGQHLAQGGGVGIRRIVNAYLANAKRQ